MSYTYTVKAHIDLESPDWGNGDIYGGTGTWCNGSATVTISPESGDPIVISGLQSGGWVGYGAAIPESMHGSACAAGYLGGYGSMSDWQIALSDDVEWHAGAAGSTAAMDKLTGEQFERITGFDADDEDVRAELMEAISDALMGADVAGLDEQDYIDEVVGDLLPGVELSDDAREAVAWAVHELGCDSDGQVERWAQEQAALSAAVAADAPAVARRVISEETITSDAATALVGAGAWSIETDDDAPDDCNSGGDSLWVVSRHQLTLDGDVVAEWTRCSVGSYGGNGGPGTRPDGWEVDEDTNGGDRLPDGVEVLLSALGLDDDIPDVPEPELASETIDANPDGDYAVYWTTVGDDERVIERYTTREDAETIAAERQRSLRATNPGNLLCGYEARVRDGGRWVSIAD